MCPAALLKPPTCAYICLPFQSARLSGIPECLGHASFVEDLHTCRRFLWEPELASIPERSNEYLLFRIVAGLPQDRILFAGVAGPRARNLGLRKVTK